MRRARDDIAIQLDDGRFDAAPWRTFLVYLTSSPKPAWEVLEPAEPRDLVASFHNVFDGMPARLTSVEALLDPRRRMLARIAQLMDDASRAFLVSVEQEAPDFDLIGLPHAADLPGVKHKLQNLVRRSPVKREADFRQLADTLPRLSRKDNA